MSTQRPDVGARKPQTMPRTPPTPTHGALLIAWGPWCKAYVDGKPVGDSPQRRPLRLTAGVHQVACRAGPCGAQKRRTITIVGGKLTRIEGLVTDPVRVTTTLTRGDAVLINRKPRPLSGFTTTAESHHVAVLKGGKTITKGWVVFPCKGRCTLVDTPKLTCR